MVQTPSRGGLRYQEIANVGAQTQRQGDAGPVRSLLGGKDLTGRFVYNGSFPTSSSLPFVNPANKLSSTSVVGRLLPFCWIGSEAKAAFGSVCWAVTGLLALLAGVCNPLALLDVLVLCEHPLGVTAPNNGPICPG